MFSSRVPDEDLIRFAEVVDPIVFNPDQTAIVAAHRASMAVKKAMMAKEAEMMPMMDKPMMSGMDEPEMPMMAEPVKPGTNGMMSTDDPVASITDSMAQSTMAA